MAQTTELTAVHGSVRDFYDAVSADYDLMTEFRKRFIRERPFFHMLVDKYQIRSALDAGAGTGFHSMLLAQLGVHVTAMDCSPNMIASVRQHAAELGLHVDARVAELSRIPEDIGGPFDAVFTLGNTLAHADSLAELQTWLRSFSAVVRPGGILFIQNLNYDRILARRQRIQNEKIVDGKTFLRFYDYQGDRVVFHLAVSNSRDDQKSFEQVVTLLPLLKDTLVDAVTSAGFTSVQTFGGVSLGPFSAKTSNDLVVLARKS